MCLREFRLCYIHPRLCITGDAMSQPVPSPQRERGTARLQAPPAQREKASARWRETGGGGYLDRIRVPVSVVAAIGGGFAHGVRVRIRAVIIDGCLAAPVSVTHREVTAHRDRRHIWIRASDSGRILKLRCSSGSRCAREEDAQFLLCCKFGLKISKRSVSGRIGCIFLNCNQRKGQVDAVWGFGEIGGVSGAEQSARQAESPTQIWVNKYDGQLSAC